MGILLSVLFGSGYSEPSHDTLWERCALATVASSAVYQKACDGVEVLRSLGAEQVETFSVDNIQVMVARMGAEVATSEGRKRCLVAVQGTHNATTFGVDLDLSLTPYGPVGGVYIHSGFAQAADDATPLLDAAYEKLGIGAEDLVTFTGHSLGGALALLLGMVRMEKGGVVEQVTTLGQPRVMDAEGAKVWKDRMNDMMLVRVRNKKDPVPCTPFRSEGYEHVGREVVLGTSYSYLSLQPEGDSDDFALKEVLSVNDHHVANYATSLLATRSSTASVLFSGLLEDCAPLPSDHQPHPVAHHAHAHVEKMLDHRCLETWELVDSD
eukprot:Hpha_TRINITY_DN14466_c0_g3::TRINITY_DN14466_c0_g3_i1::g.157272::m.157272